MRGDALAEDAGRLDRNAGDRRALWALRGQLLAEGRPEPCATCPVLQVANGVRPRWWTPPAVEDVCRAANEAGSLRLVLDVPRSVAEVAHALGVTRDNVRNLIVRGAVESFPRDESVHRSGVRVRPSAVRAALADVPPAKRRKRRT